MKSPTVLLGLIAIAVSTGGCAATQRATLEQLGHRAAFDFGCPGGQLWLYHIDSRTKAVTGCGQRLVYLEHCDALANICSWTIDTPTIAQARWNQQEATPPWAGTLTGWPPRTGSAGRPHSQPLGARPPSGTAAGAATAGSAPTEPRGRVIRTDLYGPDMARTKPQPLDPRSPPTSLFGELQESPEAPAPAPAPPSTGRPLPPPRKQPTPRPTSPSTPPPVPSAAPDFGL